MFDIIISNFRLEKIFWILKVKLVYILLTSIFFASIAGIYGSNKSTYLAQISFYVYSNPDFITDTKVNINGTELSEAKNLVSSYMPIIQSKTFLSKVQEETGLPYTIESIRSNISASSIENTPVFIVSVLDTNPENAMNIANAIGKLIPEEITRIVKSGGIEILDKAELPTAPYEPNSKIKLILMGGFGGFALSSFLFLLRGLLDTTIRKKYELADIFTVPILGDVPKLISHSKKKPIIKILNQDSPFALKESYNNIRTNLRFTGRGEKCPVYAITSADASEGKTLNTINLAISYAQINMNTLVIDADMRKSSVSTMLGIEKKDGLSEFLAGIVDEPVILEYGKNISVISTGTIPPNPAELLSSNRWYEFIKSCKEKYDAIFIDLPPVGIVSDGLLLSKEATAYILVIREKVTKFDREQMIVRKLESLGANICGFIYNGASMKSHDYIYKHYGKEYIN